MIQAFAANAQAHRRDLPSRPAVALPVMAPATAPAAIVNSTRPLAPASHA